MEEENALFTVLRQDMLPIDGHALVCNAMAMAPPVENFAPGIRVKTRQCPQNFKVDDNSAKYQASALMCRRPMSRAMAVYIVRKERMFEDMEAVRARFSTDDYNFLLEFEQTYQCTGEPVPPNLAQIIDELRATHHVYMS